MFPASSTDESNTASAMQKRLSSVAALSGTATHLSFAAFAANTPFGESSNAKQLEGVVRLALEHLFYE